MNGFFGKTRRCAEAGRLWRLIWRALRAEQSLSAYAPAGLLQANPHPSAQDRRERLPQAIKVKLQIGFLLDHQAGAKRAWAHHGKQHVLLCYRRALAGDMPIDPLEYRVALVQRLLDQTNQGWMRVFKVDPVAQAKAIVGELKKYDEALYNKPRWLVLNKLDMVDNDQRAAIVKDFVKRFKFKGPVFEISALTREGCEQLIKTIYKHVKEVQKSEQPVEEVDPRFVVLPPEPTANT